MRIFVLGGTALGVLYIMERSDMVREALARPTQGQLGLSGACQLPSKDNPMGNVLLSDFNDRPDRPSACYYPTVKKQATDLSTGVLNTVQVVRDQPHQNTKETQCLDNL